MLIALTGSTGFIGQHLVRELPRRGYRLRVLLRRPTSLPTNTASAVIGDIARPQNMSAALQDVDAVIHSAGLAQAMSGVPEDDYRVINTEATINLARAARRAGAKRFIFLSSIRAQSGPTADTVLDRGPPTQPDRCLWTIEARRRTRPGRTRHRLGVITCGAGLRARRQRQHGAADATGAFAIAVTAWRLAGPALAAGGGKFVGCDRGGACDTGDAAAAVHCRRCAGVDGRGNDRSHASWTWSLAECFLVSRDVPRVFVSRRRATARVRAAFRFARRRSLRLDAHGMDAAADH